MTRTSDDMLRDYYAIRARRDALKADRDGCYCERAEPVTHADYEDAQAEAQTDPLATFEFPQPTQKEPCWKAARQWEDDHRYRSRFYLDPPPSEWCATCQRRQVASDAYREAVRQHAGALRGLLRRGKALVQA